MSAGRPFRRSMTKGRVLVLSAEVDDDATPLEKEGAVRRRLVAITGRCPCGARLKVPANLAPGSMTVVAVEHEDDCPAVDR